MNDAYTQTANTAQILRLYLQPDAAPVMVVRIYDRVYRGRVFVSIRPLTHCLERIGCLKNERGTDTLDFMPDQLHVFRSLFDDAALAGMVDLEQDTLDTLFVRAETAAQMLAKIRSSFAAFLRAFLLAKVDEATASPVEPQQHPSVTDRTDVGVSDGGDAAAVLHVASQTDATQDDVSCSLDMPLIEATATSAVEVAASLSILADDSKSPKLLILARALCFVATYARESLVSSTEFLELLQRMYRIHTVLDMAGTAAFNAEVHYCLLRLMSVWNENTLADMRSRIRKYNELAKMPSRRAAMDERLALTVRNYNVLLRANKYISEEIATKRKNPLLCDSGDATRRDG